MKILIVIRFLLLILLTMNLNCKKDTTMGKELGKIKVDLKVYDGVQVTRLFDIKSEELEPLENQIYVFGSVINSNQHSANITINIISRDYNYLYKDKIKVGWVPANSSYPVCFLIYLGSFVEVGKKLNINDIDIQYEITKVFYK